MKTHSSAPSYRPLYDQIKVLLTQSLSGGEWRPGEAIPSEVDLALRFKVSQGTVRKAIDELAAENILVRRQGKGTFVASHSEAHSTTRFLRIVADGGKKETPESRLIECRSEKAAQDVARRLGVRAGAAIHVLLRILVLSGKPLILDKIYLPDALFPGLEAEHIGSYKGSYYSFFESQYGIAMIRAEESLKAVAAESEAALLLGVAPGTPLLSADRIAYTYGNRPVEWRRGLCVTADHSYRNELT